MVGCCLCHESWQSTTHCCQCQSRSISLLLTALCRCAADFFTYKPPGGTADVGYDYT